jgi:hypothetical protein
VFYAVRLWNQAVRRVLDEEELVAVFIKELAVPDTRL